MGKHKKKKREYFLPHSVTASVRSAAAAAVETATRSVTPTAWRCRVLSDCRPVTTTLWPMQVQLPYSAHRYYLSSETKSIGLPYVVWNLAVKYASRPQAVLVVCESMAQMATITHAKRLNRNVRAIDENDPAAYDLT